MNYLCIVSVSSVHHQCIISASSAHQQCIISASSYWGSIPLKKMRNFMKKFHKTVIPPLTAIMKSLFRTLSVFLNTYAVLNKRYEIRLTPPPCLQKSFIKFRFFLGDGFPKRCIIWWRGLLRQGWSMHRHSRIKEAQ